MTYLISHVGAGCAALGCSCSDITRSLAVSLGGVPLPLLMFLRVENACLYKVSKTEIVPQNISAGTVAYRPAFRCFSPLFGVPAIPEFRPNKLYSKVKL